MYKLFFFNKKQTGETYSINEDIYLYDIFMTAIGLNFYFETDFFFSNKICAYIVLNVILNDTTFDVFVN